MLIWPLDVTYSASSGKQCAFGCLTDTAAQVQHGNEGYYAVESVCSRHIIYYESSIAPF